MKVVADLPDPKFYRPITPSEAWYQWEDILSPRVRLKSKMANPWRSKEIVILPHFAQSKGDRSQYPVRLDLKILPFEDDDNIARVLFLRERTKGKVIHTMEPALFFAAIPLKEELLWLIYSFTYR